MERVAPKCAQRHALQMQRGNVGKFGNTHFPFVVEVVGGDFDRVVVAGDIVADIVVGWT